MGGMGFIKDNLVEKFYRDSKIGRMNIWCTCIPYSLTAVTMSCLFISGQIYEGTSFIQLNTIAKCLDEEFKKK